MKEELRKRTDRVKSVLSTEWNPKVRDNKCACAPTSDTTEYPDVTECIKG